MNEEQLKRELDEELAKELTIGKSQPRPVLRPVDKAPSTLNDQWNTFEKVGRELRDRIRRERLKIMAEYDQDLLDIQQSYNDKISNTVAMLEGERNDAMARLAHQTAERLRDHDLLEKRLG